MGKPTDAVTPGHRIKVTPVRSGRLEEVHVAAAARPAQADASSQAESLYQAIVERLEDAASLRIVAERIFGQLGSKERCLSGRAAALRRAGMSADTPVTYLEGAPIAGRGLAGVQMTLVRTGTGDVQVEPIRDGELTCGFSVNVGAVRRAYLAGVHGLEAGPVASPVVQARLMFERADRLLAASGLSYRNVVCTRIYLRRLLDWYQDFNGVRNAFYRELGILTDEGPSPVPASTGIQGKMSDDCECVMSVTAVRTGAEDRCPFVKLHNPLQDEATDYGSAFARGVRVELPGVNYVLISGTASIDEAGKTVHLGDPLGQTRRTMANFETIMKVGGATPADLYHAVWFCKDPSYAEVIRQETRRQGWPEFPYVMVRADVCRHDLLVEIDGAALLATG